MTPEPTKKLGELPPPAFHYPKAANCQPIAIYGRKRKCWSSFDIPVTFTWQWTSSQPKGGWLTARELARYKSDLVGVQEVRWDRGGTVRAGDYNFFCGKGNKIINCEQLFCAPQNSIRSLESRVC